MAKELIDSFADAGIVCSVLAVDEDDPIEKRFLSSAARADLLILDWELHRDGGKTARELISAVFEQDAAAKRKRLRVIAIYTGQPALVRIINDIRKHLDLPDTALDDDGLTLAQGNVRITAFSKPLNEDLRPELKHREVAEENLPQRLVREFAWLTNGLVPAVALASLAAVRTDTHRILQALSSQLDVGYLGHRVASSFPEDAQDHLVDMIVAEIGSVLGENDVGRHADLSVIKEWLAAECSGESPLVCGSALPFEVEAGFDAAAMEKLLDVGLGLDEELKQHERRGVGEKTLKRVRKQAAHLFADAAEAAEESGDLLALRMAVRTVYSRPSRRLRLGTIVLHGDAYLVCLQPRCDSVRLDSGTPRGFPFLPLQTVDREKEVGRDFVVAEPESRKLIRLQLRMKPFHLVIHEFMPGPQRHVQAESAGDGAWTFSDAAGQEFRWVAELKPEFAQRVAADFAAEIARVGLAESELMRLSRD